ncbi:unnamed protein product, partial [Musa acuminata subsp. burmannicoides]
MGSCRGCSPWWYSRGWPSGSEIPHGRRAESFADHLQCPIAYLSRLQRIRPVVRAEFHFPMATRGYTTT